MPIIPAIIRSKVITAGFGKLDRIDLHINRMTVWENLLGQRGFKKPMGIGVGKAAA
jgi:hypothetical protein